MTQRIPRVCIRLYAVSGSVPDTTIIPIFHRWIRDRMLDFVFIDVADYAHVPEGPGVMLVTDGVTFGLDRADGRVALLAQQRRPAEGTMADAIALALQQTLAVADALEREGSLRGTLSFDRSRIRIEINDRLLAPNDDASFDIFAPAVLEATGRLFRGSPPTVTRVRGDTRGRLAIDTSVGELLESVIPQGITASVS